MVGITSDVLKHTSILTDDGSYTHQM